MSYSPDEVATLQRAQMMAWRAASLERQAQDWARAVRAKPPAFQLSMARALRARQSASGHAPASLLQMHGIQVVVQEAPFAGLPQAQAGTLLRAVLDLRKAQVTLYRDAARETEAALAWCGDAPEGALEELVLAHEAFHLLARTHDERADECAANLFATLTCGWQLFAGMLDLVVLSYRAHRVVTVVGEKEGPLP